MNRIIITADTTEADLKALTDQFGEGSIKFIKMKTRGRKKGFRLEKGTKLEITDEKIKDEKKATEEVIEPKIEEKVTEKKVEIPKPAPVVKKKVVKKVKTQSVPKKNLDQKNKKKGSFYDPYF